MLTEKFKAIFWKNPFYLLTYYAFNTYDKQLLIGYENNSPIFIHQKMDIQVTGNTVGHQIDFVSAHLKRMIENKNKFIYICLESDQAKMIEDVINHGVKHHETVNYIDSIKSLDKLHCMNSFFMDSSIIHLKNSGDCERMIAYFDMIIKLDIDKHRAIFLERFRLVFMVSEHNDLNDPILLMLNRVINQGFVRDEYGTIVKGRTGLGTPCYTVIKQDGYPITPSLNTPRPIARISLSLNTCFLEQKDQRLFYTID